MTERDIIENALNRAGIKIYTNEPCYVEFENSYGV